MGPHRLRHAAAKLDMYRKVPTDLMEGTKQGSMWSLLTLATIFTLIFLETKDFLTTRIVTDLALDSYGNNHTTTDNHKFMMIHFNITMLDLECAWAEIDVVSALGTVQTNIEQTVEKWPLDANGVKQSTMYNQNKRHHIHLRDTSITQSLTDLYANGKDAIPLDEGSLTIAQEDYNYVFCLFYDPMSVTSQEVLPTWEVLAELLKDVGFSNHKHQMQRKTTKITTTNKDDEEEGEDVVDDDDQEEEEEEKEIYSDSEYAKAEEKLQQPVLIGTVDCREHLYLCSDTQRIKSYPTIRLFVDGMPYKGGDYVGDRTLLALLEYLLFTQEEGRNQADQALHYAHERAREWMTDEQKEFEQEEFNHHVDMERKRLMHRETYSQHTAGEDHPGCQLSGSIKVDRTPGRFHIRAKSKSQDFVAHMTNTSHIVHSLMVGDFNDNVGAQDHQKLVANLHRLEQEAAESLGKNDNHTIHDKNLLLLDKIAPMDGNLYTTLDWHQAYHHYLTLVPTTTLGNLHIYQILGNSELSTYSQEEIPEAMFVYDLSPIAIYYITASHHWYDYCTSIMAIIGGVFTVLGMTNAILHGLFKNLWRVTNNKHHKQKKNKMSTAWKR